MPQPSDLFDVKKVQENGWTEEDCLKMLTEAALPQKVKEVKTSGGQGEQTKGGAEVFIPKKRAKKTKFPKNYDASNPG